MKKNLLIGLSLAALLAASFNPVLATAKTDDEVDYNVPEQDGTYDVPGHADMKVKVIVHKAKKAENELGVCALSDPDSSAAVGLTGWNLPSTWSYQLNPSSLPPTISSANFATLTDLSYKTWEAVSPVRFTRGANTALIKAKYDRKNIVAFNRLSAGTLAMTYTTYYPTTGVVVDQDTIFNKSYAWSWTPYNLSACPSLTAYDAQDIFTHELGHWMGLDDHYTAEYTYNTMFGYGGKGEIYKDTLTAGDIAGIKLIY